MKKFLSILLILAMIFCFAACGGDEPAVDEDGQDGQQQKQQDVDEQQADDEQQSDSGQENAQQNPDSQQSDSDQEDAAQADEDSGSSEELPTTGLPQGWPENDYTALVPVPDEGGKVLTSGEMGTLFSIELKWEMEQGLAYAQKLADAGFGEDCAEKYETYGYIDRTVNGVNVQLMDLFGMTSLCIMTVE